MIHHPLDPATDTTANNSVVHDLGVLQVSRQVHMLLTTDRELLLVGQVMVVRVTVMVMGLLRVLMVLLLLRLLLVVVLVVRVEMHPLLVMELLLIRRLLLLLLEESLSLADHGHVAGTGRSSTLGRQHGLGVREMMIVGVAANVDRASGGGGRHCR